MAQETFTAKHLCFAPLAADCVETLIQMICYKEHLQRQNSSNGGISPPAASVSSLSESLPVQCTDVRVPDALSVLDSMSSSIRSGSVSNQSLLSESVAPFQVDSTSVDTAVSETEDLQGTCSS